MSGLEQAIKKLALDSGAAAVGVAGPERLTGPPSLAPTYLMPGARSIVSLMLPLDGDILSRYLGKEDFNGLQRHETEVYRKLYTIGQKVAEYLESEGYQAQVADVNLDYRFKNEPAYKAVTYKAKQKTVDWLAKPSGPLMRTIKRRMVRRGARRSMREVDWSLTPSFSHRYGAVAAGLGSLGWSGNVLHPDYGARVYYETVLTDTELGSDPMMEENPCSGCRTCARVCQSGFIHMKDKDEVNIGGKTFSHNRKAANLRCVFVCAGFTGKSRHQGWSTWSPGRLTLPEEDDRLEAFWEDMVKEHMWRGDYIASVLSDLVFHTEYGFIRKPFHRFHATCGFCQFVCAKTLEERKGLYDLIVESGEVVEGPDTYYQPKKESLPDKRRDV
ncbi:MAG: hypothetical protein JSU92_08405 [Deltaproteobacteria bacterium]|nr:MAG: hypothetical protein JSU92_08405 [Deltaproteobacteria bacterium]